jgi:hypothetical protein
VLLGELLDSRVDSAEKRGVHGQNYENEKVVCSVFPLERARK